MKTLKQSFDTKHSTATDIALLILRLSIGVWMLSKGLPKVGMLVSDEINLPAVLGMSSQLSLGLTLFAQVICSVLLLVGFATRFAAIVLGMNMLVAVVVAHGNDPFVKSEPALHFLLVYVVLLLTGGGKFSIDFLINGRTHHITEKINYRIKSQNMKAATTLHLLFPIALFMLTACSTTSVTKTTNASVNSSDMLVRISEIEIHPDSLTAYNAILKEEAEASVRLEPGVISIFPMYQQKDSTQIRILEIYASKEAYQSHIKSPHFLHYKTATLSMVKALRLIDMNALDVETMTKIFKKLKD